MSSLAFRDALVATLLDWAKPKSDLRLYLENGAHVDMDKDTRPVVGVEIRYLGSAQVDMHEQPLIRDDGKILLTILVREMTGVRTAYQLRDELATLIQRKTFGGARVGVGERVANTTEVKGWVGFRIAFPFKHYYLS